MESKLNGLSALDKLCPSVLDNDRYTCSAILNSYNTVCQGDWEDRVHLKRGWKKDEYVRKKGPHVDNMFLGKYQCEMGRKKYLSM